MCDVDLFSCPPLYAYQQASGREQQQARSRACGRQADGAGSLFALHHGGVLRFVLEKLTSFPMAESLLVSAIRPKARRDSQKLRA
jgi:hypothetical protein